VKSSLLEGLSAEPVALVRSAFSDAISKLAAVIAPGERIFIELMKSDHKLKA
jgi:hypothetical protein